MLEQTLLDYFAKNQVPISQVNTGEYSFGIEIKSQNFAEFAIEEQFVDARPADAIADNVTINCYLLAHDPATMMTPPDTVMLFAELNRIDLSAADPYLLLSVVNEFNGEGVLAGAVFFDVEDKALLYRHLFVLEPSLTDTDAAIDKFFSRSVAELTYCLQGFHILKNRLAALALEKREQGPAKVIALHPKKP